MARRMLIVAMAVAGLLTLFPGGAGATTRCYEQAVDYPTINGTSGRSGSASASWSKDYGGSINTSTSGRDAIIDLFGLSGPLMGSGAAHASIWQDDLVCGYLYDVSLSANLSNIDVAAYNQSTQGGSGHGAAIDVYFYAYPYVCESRYYSYPNYYCYPAYDYGTSYYERVFCAPSYSYCSGNANPTVTLAVNNPSYCSSGGIYQCEGAYTRVHVSASSNSRGKGYARANATTSFSEATGW